MAINFANLLYLMCQNTFSVPCIFHPVYSQPEGTAASYSARGIFDQDEFETLTEDGGVFTDHRDIFDIRTAEWDIRGLPHPKQKDRVTIPYDCNGAPLGEFEVEQATLNGGGEMTLVLRKWKSP